MTGHVSLKQAASQLNQLDVDQTLNKLEQIGKSNSGRIRNEGTFFNNASSQRKDLRLTLEKFEQKICGNDKEMKAAWNRAKTWGKYKSHDLTGKELQTLVKCLRGVQKARSADQDIKANKKILDNFKYDGGQKALMFHAAKKQFLHPNSKSQGIMNEGLQPRYGGTGAAKADSKAFEQQCQGKVHFTRSQKHAHAYKTMFETGKHPENSTLDYKDTGPAEVLKIAMPKDQYQNSVSDPDDMLARTLSEPIKPEQIRGTSPKPLPGPKDKTKADEYASAWKTHQKKGKVENEAVYSYLPDNVKEMLSQYDDPATALQMLKQGMMSTRSANRRSNMLGVPLTGDEAGKR